MTREEAIDLLDNLIGFIEDSRNSDYDTAFKMGIKALEQEPCDKCVYSTKDGYCQYDDITEAIPPVTPQPKTGHWIAEFVPREQPDNWDRIVIKCSECGVVKTRIMYNADTMDFDETVRDYTNTLKKNHYCFNCGAKMVESQEREDKGSLC